MKKSKLNLIFFVFISLIFNLFVSKNSFSETISLQLIRYGNNDVLIQPSTYLTLCGITTCSYSYLDSSIALKIDGAVYTSGSSFSLVVYLTPDLKLKIREGSTTLGPLATDKDVLDFQVIDSVSLIAYTADRELWLAGWSSCERIATDVDKVFFKKALVFVRDRKLYYYDGTSIYETEYSIPEGVYDYDVDCVYRSDLDKLVCTILDRKTNQFYYEQALDSLNDDLSARSLVEEIGIKKVVRAPWSIRAFLFLLNDGKLVFYDSYENRVRILDGPFYDLQYHKIPYFAVSAFIEKPSYLDVNIFELDRSELLFTTPLETKYFLIENVNPGSISFENVILSNSIDFKIERIEKVSDNTVKVVVQSRPRYLRETLATISINLDSTTLSLSVKFLPETEETKAPALCSKDPEKIERRVGRAFVVIDKDLKQPEYRQICQ